jgi:hypothetical protein
MCAMTKRQLIDEILTFNRSARPAFLAKFDDRQLNDYLLHLKITRTPRLAGDPHRFDHYFADCPAIAVGEDTAAVVHQFRFDTADEPDRAAVEVAPEPTPADEVYHVAGDTPPLVQPTDIHDVDAADDDEPLERRDDADEAAPISVAAPLAASADDTEAETWLF